MLKYVKVKGIHCDNCVKTITKEFLKNKKITSVTINNNIVTITSKEDIPSEKIINTINTLGYYTKDKYIYNNLNDINKKINLIEFIIILGLILILNSLVNFNIIPTIDSNITYGMLFVTGLLSSIHCISMCGAINLLAITGKKSYQNTFFYNIGRVISYTLLGGICGLIGSVFKINNYLSGIIIVLSSFLMFLMALNTLGLIQFNLPKIFKNNLKINNAFILGLLNGFMPCGILQAMQVYALTTGSFFKGALAMFLFSLGTVPLMLMIGLAYNLIKGKAKYLINKVASVLILVLSLTMLNRGLLSLNIDVTSLFNKDNNYLTASVSDDYQVVEFALNYNSYQDIKVKKDIPVKMIINVDKKYLTGCNNEIKIPEYGINKKLEVGQNIIEFTPTKTGIFTYTCWMQMVKNNIKVVS